MFLDTTEEALVERSGTLTPARTAGAPSRQGLTSSDRKYCSTNCRDEFRKARTGEKHPLYNRQDYACDVCGKKMLITPSMLKTRSKCLCSKECRIENHRRVMTGKPRSFKRAGKNAARVRDGNRCVICGFDVVTAVHHIVARKDGGSNELTNLVTLCPNHHYMAHAGMIPVSEMKAKAKSFDFHQGIPVLTKTVRGLGPTFNG